jgi:alpha-glucosidase (family GH31 glycosyl hydrolase)
MDGYEYPTRPKAKDEQSLQGDKWRIQVLTDGLVRCEWADDGHFEDRASTFAINRDLPPAKFRQYEKGGMLNIVTERFRLVYDKKPFSSSGLFLDVLSKDLHWANRWRFGDFSSSLGGTARTLDHVDGRCELGPGVVSTKGYAALDDRETLLFDGNNWVSGRRPGNRQDLYVFAFGLDHHDAIKAFYAISGSQPLLPRFTFGNWWSRYHEYSAQEYNDLMDQFASDDIPLSVAVIDMDWHLVQEKRVTHRGWTGYSWNKDLFPDPAAFLEGLRKRNLKVTLNDHPAEGIHAFEDVYAAMAKEMDFDVSNQDPILFDSVNPTFLKAYLKMWRSLGIDFDWIDWQQGTESVIPGVDPLWLLNHYHYLENRHVNRIPLIFSRYAGPGSHRYPVGFSGDSHVTWGSLDFQPEFTATASNIGFGWWSHDIGGHMFGERDDEMVTRWVEYGCFSPFLRLHSTSSRWMSKEPWRFSAEAHDAIRSLMRFRHRLIPYLHTMNVRSAEENEPLVQPVYWRHSRRDEAYEHRNSYYFGSSLFVAPITTQRSTSSLLGKSQAWLPPGPNRYVDLFSGLSYAADTLHSFYRPLGQIPVLLPEGSILPLDGALRPKNGVHNPQSLELVLVPGQDASFCLVEDPADDAGAADSSSHASQRRSTFTYKHSARQLTVKVDGPALPNRTIAVRVVGTRDGSFVPLAANAIPGPQIARMSGETLDFPLEVSLEPGAPPLAKTLEPLVDKLQCPFQDKDRIWNAVAKGNSAVAKIGKLLQLGLSEDLTGPIVERLLACEVVA